MACKNSIIWSMPSSASCGMIEGVIVLSSMQLRSDTYRRLMNNEFNCEKELTMSILAGKYKVVIIWHLGNEHPHRYGELSRLFKEISNRMLTKQLRELEQDGIVERKIYPESPPRVEYSLTELGFTLLPVVNHIYRWGRNTWPITSSACTSKAAPSRRSISCPAR